MVINSESVAAFSLAGSPDTIRMSPWSDAMWPVKTISLSSGISRAADNIPTRTGTSRELPDIFRPISFIDEASMLATEISNVFGERSSASKS